MKAIDQKVTNDFAIYNGDSCDLIKSIPDNSIDFGIHSPPFEGLYKFSASSRDLSNSDGPNFWKHYAFLIKELLRVTKPHRIHSVHVMQLPTSKTRHGYIGMRDFRGEVIRAYEESGWIFHSEVCVWKDPVVAQQRTKSIRLLHKQITKDSTLSGMGLADYIVSFRKHGENEDRVDGFLKHWAGDDSVDISREGYEIDVKRRAGSGQKAWPFETWRSILIWQRYASPVWSDIRQTRTLQYRGGRDSNDEQHISPLQLDVIERCIELWSLPGETVLTPFLGIGSEVYCAVEMGRKGIGFELKKSYYDQAVRNMSKLYEDRTKSLFEGKQ